MEYLASGSLYSMESAEILKPIPLIHSHYDRAKKDINNMLRQTVTRGRHLEEVILEATCDWMTER
jgi:hypothetical protein